MKKTLLIALLISNGAIAQTTYLYGAQGESLGTVQRSGNTQYFTAHRVRVGGLLCSQAIQPMSMVAKVKA